MFKILFFFIIALILYIFILDDSSKKIHQDTYKKNNQLKSSGIKTTLRIDNNIKQEETKYNKNTKIKQPKSKIDINNAKQVKVESNKSINIFKKNTKAISKKLKVNSVVGENITIEMIKNANDQATKERLIDEYLYFQSLNNKNNEGIGLSDSDILEIINQDNLNRNTEISKNQAKEEDIEKKLGINNNKDITIDDKAYQKSLQAKYIDEGSLSDEEILNLIIEDSKE